MSYKYNTDTFKEMLLRTIGNKYDLSKVIYERSNKKITLICPIHGDFSLLANGAQQGSGCPKCMVDHVANLKKTSQEEFLAKANAATNNFYDLSMAKYVNAKTKVQGVCPIHGKFSVLPEKLYYGSGCNKCKVGGFNLNYPGYLYLLKSEGMVKIGITNKDVDVRLKQINRKSPEAFTIYSKFYFESGEDASNLETELLLHMRRTYKNPSSKFDGSTESFTDLGVEEALKLIKQTMENIANTGNIA